MTLVEVMIALAISSFVMVAVASLQSISGRVIKNSYGEARTRSLRMRTLDGIRYRLARANLASLTVADANHRLTYNDPVSGTTCQFFFNTATRTLTFDSDTDDAQAARKVVDGPIDITFEVEQDPSSGTSLPIIRLKVKSASATARGDVDTQDGETSIFLRNTQASAGP